MDVVLKNRSEYTISFVFFLIVSILGLLGVNWAVSNFAMVRASSSWMKTDGIVLNSGARPNETFRYTYSFDGIIYESERRAVFLIPETQQEQIFTPGEKIEVFINPENHEYSVLNRGGGVTILFTISLICSAFVFFGFAGLVRIFFSQYELARYSQESAYPAE